MQPVGSVVFNLFNSDPASTNSRPRCVQSQGCYQSNRRVHENKDAMPSMLRDVSSTSAHKTVGWISSLNLGNMKPVLLVSTLVNQFSPILGRTTPDAWPPSSAVEKIMTLTNCSTEAATEILKVAMKVVRSAGLPAPAADCESQPFVEMAKALSAGAVAGVGSALIAFALYKCTLAIRKRLCSGNEARPPVETRLSNEPKIVMTERPTMPLSAEERLNNEPKIVMTERPPMPLPAEAQLNNDPEVAMAKRDSINDPEAAMAERDSINDPEAAMAERDSIDNSEEIAMSEGDPMLPSVEMQCSDEFKTSLNEEYSERPQKVLIKQGLVQSRIQVFQK